MLPFWSKVETERKCQLWNLAIAQMHVGVNKMSCFGIRPIGHNDNRVAQIQYEKVLCFKDVEETGATLDQKAPYYAFYLP